jgi:hypothetical protein
MTISSLVDTTTTGDFEFTISNVDNPYSAYGATGFALVIYDSDGAGNIEKASSFDLGGITTAADLTSVQISVASSTTVEESSFTTILIYGPLPYEADCQVIITFPDTFTIESNGYSVYAGSNAFQDADITDVTGNVVTIDACPTGESFAADQWHRIVLKSLSINPPYVKDTDNFNIQVNDIVDSISYVAAELGADVTAIIEADDLVAGSITSMTLTAVDSQIVQDTTTFTLNL